MAGYGLVRTLSGLALVLAIFGTANPVAATGTAVLEASTEGASLGEIRPSAPLVGFILQAVDKDDVGQLDDCIADKGLRRGDYGTLLRAVPIRNAAGRTLWFVRPAQQPYCQAFYGAHLFRYFLVEERQKASSSRYRMVFRNGGDGFAVYPALHHGLNDIEATGCIATGCRSARLAYDGRTYRPVRCTRTTSDEKGRARVLAGRCGADEGSDYQSTGMLDR